MEHHIWITACKLITLMQLRHLEQCWEQLKHEMPDLQQQWEWCQSLQVLLGSYWEPPCRWFWQPMVRTSQRSPAHLQPTGTDIAPTLLYSFLWYGDIGVLLKFLHFYVWEWTIGFQCKPPMPTVKFLRPQYFPLNYSYLWKVTSLCITIVTVTKQFCLNEHSRGS